MLENSDNTLTGINAKLGHSRTRRNLAFQILDVEMKGGSHENDSHSPLTPDQLMTSLHLLRLDRLIG
ncbi:unnamed protein product [Rodentolepis nana]|uniref:Uncharacterized protein n=1 Tax=Rodentolepis nana TaxID=102285 RepID=A0A0R3T7G7_RODNA|nr:unnamed protein product [Rodentolepis nana]